MKLSRPISRVVGGMRFSTPGVCVPADGGWGGPAGAAMIRTEFAWSRRAYASSMSSLWRWVWGGAGVWAGRVRVGHSWNAGYPKVTGSSDCAEAVDAGCRGWADGAGGEPGLGRYLYKYQWVYAVQVRRGRSTIAGERMREYLLKGGFMMVGDSRSADWRASCPGCGGVSGPSVRLTTRMRSSSAYDLEPVQCRGSDIRRAGRMRGR